MASIFADLLEPVGGLLTADSLSPTSDSLSPTVDSVSFPGAADASDAIINANFITVDIVEPAAAVVTADTANYTADNATWPSADGGIVTAIDICDGEIIAAELPVGGGGFLPPFKPFPVTGRGYGILPELEGESFGVVTVAGTGAGELGELTGAASGTIGVTGRASARMLVRAAAIGQRGVCGTVAGKLERVAASAPGSVGAYGLGSGTIAKCEGAAVGQHDDDEAAVMAFLVAA